MTQYDYQVLPAPTRGTKAKGVKTTADRFALTLAETLNTQAAEGWEFMRAETLPCEERSGLTGKTTSFQHVLIFRRAATAEAETPTLIEDQTVEVEYVNDDTTDGSDDLDR